MPFNAPPNTAAWRHAEARDGFEVAFFRPRGGGYRIEGCTTAVEDGQTWAVTYLVDLDSRWTTRSVQVTSRTAAGTARTELETDGAGNWRVNGEPAPHITGCLDVDLESSAMTNALPIHRLDPPTGARVSTPAAYVRALDLSVERLEQEYTRAGDSGCRYDYVSPAFDFSCRLTYDASGLVLDYPGIATRTA
jgi:hypothetical protein